MAACGGGDRGSVGTAMASPANPGGEEGGGGTTGVPRLPAKPPMSTGADFCTSRPGGVAKKTLGKQLAEVRLRSSKPGGAVRTLPRPDGNGAPTSPSRPGEDGPREGTILSFCFKRLRRSAGSKLIPSALSAELLLEVAVPHTLPPLLGPTKSKTQAGSRSSSAGRLWAARCWPRRGEYAGGGDAASNAGCAALIAAVTCLGAGAPPHSRPGGLLTVSLHGAGRAMTGEKATFFLTLPPSLVGAPSAELLLDPAVPHALASLIKLAKSDTQAGSPVPAVPCAARLGACEGGGGGKRAACGAANGGPFGAFESLAAAHSCGITGGDGGGGEVMPPEDAPLLGGSEEATELSAEVLLEADVPPQLLLAVARALPGAACADAWNHARSCFMAAPGCTRLGG